jgi:hypothetical protein
MDHSAPSPRGTWRARMGAVGGAGEPGADGTDRVVVTSGALDGDRLVAAG